MTDQSDSHETWEKEILARHRWGQHGDRVEAEYFRIKKLGDVIKPVDNTTKEIIDQIVAIEICNWNLEESILALCEAIGTGEPAALPIGHMRSVSDERWRKIWAYWLALRKWLPRQGPSGYSSLLTMVDSNAEIESHVEQMLGDYNELKELYVERFCLCIESFLDGSFGDMNPSCRAHETAVPALDRQIQKLDPDGQMLSKMMYGTGGARLFPCSHKLFRRYDIILSSIGYGKWRGAIPVRGTDGFERANLCAGYLDPIDSWITNSRRVNAFDSPAGTLISALGKPNDKKRFLAALLVSLLRAQELAAIERARSRSGKQIN